MIFTNHKIRLPVGIGYEPSSRYPAARRFGIDAFKPEQEDLTKAFVGWRDMFVCMPTGIAWQVALLRVALLPYVYDHFHGFDTSQPSQE